MQRFRYRHHVEAVQWKGDNEQELKEFSDFIAIHRGNSPIVFIPKLDKRLGIVVNEVNMIAQDGTLYPVRVGQWLFADSQAFVRVKDDIPFRIMFEHVPEPIPDPKPKTVIWDDDQETPPHFAGRLHQARPGAPFQNSKEIMSFLLTMGCKGGPYADCPTCGKEWKVPRAWKSWKSAKNHNKKGKKAKVVCVDCSEREVMAKHQRYKYTPDSETIKDNIREIIADEE